jgi:hypothetical protein
MKNVALLVLASLFSFEFFSFVATEANLLLFNEIPTIYRPAYSGNDWRTQNEPWGSWHKVNATDRQRTRCFDVTYRSNEVGARDTPFSLEKTGSKSRYILLGDSFAEGYGVNFESTAKAQLEKLLGIDVYNFGSAGYFGPVQYYLIYKDLARQYQHDGVILFFLPANDFTDNDFSVWKGFRPTWYRPYYKKLSDGQYDIFYPNQAIPNDHLENDPREHFEGLAAGGLIQSFLVRYTFMSNTMRTIKYLLATNPIQQVNYSGYYDATPEEQEAAIYFIEKIVREVGPRRVTILVIPSREDLIRISTGRSYKDQYWVRHLRSLEMANSNVNVIDMADDLPGDYQNLFLSCDNHWSALGNLVAAKIIAARYRSSNRRSPTASSN